MIGVYHAHTWICFCFLCVPLACGEPDKPDSGASQGTSTGDTSTSGSTSAASTGATSSGLVCDLVDLTNTAAGASVKDCGIVDPWSSTLAEWQAAADCVLAASAAETPFKMIAWRDSPNGKSGTGFLGFAGTSFGLATIVLDSLGTVFELTCTTISATPNCTITVGESCLTCEGETSGIKICSTP